MTLVTATDSAYPYDYTQRPPDCRVIMGYVGRPGYTPHVWSLAEADAARATGCEWWPIGVGISQGPTNAQDGLDLAAYMIAVLPGYRVAKTTPVFMDLEPDALRADMAGAEAAVNAWRQLMRADGYTRPYVYSVDAPFIDWVANWDNVRPTGLPVGKVGVQYGGAQSPPNYDLSVFDSALLAGGDDLTPDEHKWLLDLHNWFLAPPPQGTTNLGQAIAATLPTAQATYNKVNALPTADAIAAAIVAKLPPGSGASLADINQAIRDALNATHLAVQ